MARSLKMHSYITNGRAHKHNTYIGNLYQNTEPIHTQHTQQSPPHGQFNDMAAAVTGAGARVAAALTAVPTAAMTAVKMEAATARVP